jgi:glycosyltransferase involved in cell wall biosynthesis
MRLGISAFAGDAGKSGISQYMINIFKRLPIVSAEDEFVFFMSHSDREYFDLGLPRARVVSYPDWVGHPVINIFWHLFWLPLALRFSHCDCVYMPAGNRRLAWFYGVPSVGTVHDMSQLHVPAKYDRLRMFYIMKILPRMMRRLTRVLSISASTRSDLKDYAGVNPENIRVIYNGADLDCYHPGDAELALHALQEKLPIPDRYILYVSRLEHPGKNHVRLIQAFAELKKTDTIPQKLVLVGGRWNGAEMIDQAVADNGLENDVIFPGFVGAEMLPDLYRAADLFVFPSLFEGFGIPVLEAMASGTPVCASRASSIPEVLGDAGLLFDPESVEDMVSAMRLMLNEPDLLANLKQKGIERASSFTWDKSALGVIHLCHEASGR